MDLFKAIFDESDSNMDSSDSDEEARKKTAQESERKKGESSNETMFASPISALVSDDHSEGRNRKALPYQLYIRPDTPA